MKFVATKNGLTTKIFSPLSFVAVFGSGIRDKHPGSATLVGIQYINRSQTHECGNWDGDPDIPFLGIFVSKFRYFVFAVYPKIWDTHFSFCASLKEPKREIFNLLDCRILYYKTSMGKWLRGLLKMQKTSFWSWFWSVFGENFELAHVWKGLKICFGGTRSKIKLFVIGFEPICKSPKRFLIFLLFGYIMYTLKLENSGF